jgi:phosphatidylinositol-4,5-bisphosphate 3-kinase catalytic subunit alpha/beta/delta
MISTGIPQLTSHEDLAYLIESFCIGKTDAQAREIFHSLILESLNTKATQLNFAIHILAHPD